MIDDVATLFKLAGNQGRPDDWNDYFDPIGLILQIPPKREDYWCTPLNALTFARTGGDCRRRRTRVPVPPGAPGTRDPPGGASADLRLRRLTRRGGTRRVSRPRVLNGGHSLSGRCSTHGARARERRPGQARYARRRRRPL
jgi:hypothetical protein